MVSVAQIDLVPIDEVVTEAGRNPRTNFDEGRLFDLQRSMTELSQLAPVILNRTEKGLELIAGERRLRAAKAGGAPVIEAKIFSNLSSVRAMEITLAENREHDPLNVIERAGSYLRALDAGITEADLARMEGLTVETLRRRMDLLELPDEVQRLMQRQNNPLPVHQALCLKGLEPADQIALARRAAPQSGRVLGEEEVRALAAEARDKRQGRLDDHGKPKKVRGKKAIAGKTAAYETALDTDEEKTTRLPVRVDSRESAAGNTGGRDLAKGGLTVASGKTPLSKSARPGIEVSGTFTGRITVTGSSLFEIEGASLQLATDEGSDVMATHSLKCDMVLDCTDSAPAMVKGLLAAIARTLPAPASKKKTNS